MDDAEVTQIAHGYGDRHASFLDISAGELLRRTVQRVPDRIALIVPPSADGSPERTWRYRELLAEAESAAAALLGAFRPGDHVAVWAAASHEVLILQLGAALAGIVLVAVNPANRAGELHYLLTQSRSRGLFLDRNFRGLDNEAAMRELDGRLPDLEVSLYMDQWDNFLAAAGPVEFPEVSPESPALILFTSGSTGKPKAAVLQHKAIVNNAALAARHVGIGEGEIWLNVLPMFHVGGTVTMTLGCIATAGTQILLPQFTPDAMLEVIERYRATVTMAVPTMQYALLESPRFDSTDFSSLKLIVAGGSPVSPELLRRVKRQMGVEVANLMGQTEASGTMFATRPGDDEERVTGSVGAPLPLSEVKIVSNEDGRTLGVRETGEICVLTRCAMKEYFGMAEKSGETLDEQGWLHTGDLGYMREDGYIQVTGRLKEMIIRGGENIFPREIEDVLAEHPDISQSAVFGVSDEKWGEQVAAAIIPRAGHSPDPEEIAEFLRQRISRHKVPKFWQVLESLPLNASGKVQKFLLQEQFENNAKN